MWRFPTVHGIIRDVITVLSVGGSIIAPDRPDPEFLRAFRAAIGDYLAAHADDRLVFVIGGPYGFSEEVYSRSDFRISLSRMTFSHQMVRAIFTEQLYRAFAILRNEPYHHE